ncbi:MAG: C4-dicarboxylate transporter DctA [Polyangiaceae bacterium]|nr:C4-dicarboxylate transporter DctA [Polyangiaceae bacterium]
MSLPKTDAPPADDAEAPKSRGPSLYVQVMIGIAAGVILGVVRPKWGVAMQPLGEAFVGLIKMLIAPIVFTTVSVGIAGMGDLKKVGRVGAKAVLYFEIMTTVALAVGLVVVHVVKPGAGIHATEASLDTSGLTKTLGAPHPTGVVAHFMGLVPESFLGAFVSGNVMQVLVIAVLTGVALASMRQKAAPLISLLEQVSHGFFAIIGIVMKAAPLGAFGAMAFTIGKFGIGTLGNLAKLMFSFYATALFFVFVVLGLVLRSLGFSIFRLVAYLREELVIVLGTSSSESALPRLMSKLETLGCSAPVVRLVVPTGYSFNLDGTCIYLTMASIFVAQAMDVPLDLGQQLALLAVLLLTSKGAAGVTGSGFVTLAATLQSTGTVPVAGISLLLGVDRFMSEARALTNMMGNAVATIVVSRWEKELDMDRARGHIGWGTSPSAAPPEKK